MSPEPFRVLIAEDEAPARETMRGLLAGIRGVVCVGEAWGRGVLDEIRQLGPDIVLLDIRMPGMTGFEVVQTLERELGEDVPVVVVVTAHEEHAVEAFEVRAIDYLLKPFTDERFVEAVERATETVRLRGRRDLRADPGAASPAPRGGGGGRLLLDDSGTTLVIPVDEIRWVEASGSYVVVHAGEDHLVRRSLGSLEEELDGRGFARVHRSALVNAAAVRAVRPLTHGDAVTVLDDGTSVRVSRSRRAAFETVLRDLA